MYLLQSVAHDVEPAAHALGRIYYRFYERIVACSVAHVVLVGSFMSAFVARLLCMTASCRGDISTLLIASSVNQWIEEV